MALPHSSSTSGCLMSAPDCACLGKHQLEQSAHPTGASSNIVENGNITSYQKLNVGALHMAWKRVPPAPLVMDLTRCLSIHLSITSSPEFPPGRILTSYWHAIRLAVGGVRVAALEHMAHIVACVPAHMSNESSALLTKKPTKRLLGKAPTPMRQTQIGERHTCSPAGGRPRSTRRSDSTLRHGRRGAAGGWRRRRPPRNAARCALLRGAGCRGAGTAPS